MICSGFASSVLQGVLFMQTLKDLKTSEILEFIQKNCGEKPDRKQLIQKIRATLLQETEPTDTVEKIFWNAFRKNKFLNYNSRFIMSMNLVKQLDRLT